MKTADEQMLMELLPWYVNGTLSSEEKDWVDKHVNESEQARNELAFLESLATDTRESIPPSAQAIGLDKAMARIHQEQASPGTARDDRFLTKLRTFITNSFSQKPMVGLAYSLVALQAGVIALLMSTQQPTKEELTVRSTAPVIVAPAANEKMIEILAAEDANAQEFLQLIASIDGKLISAPNHDGTLLISVPNWNVNKAMKALNSTSLVSTAKITNKPTLP